MGAREVEVDEPCRGDDGVPELAHAFELDQGSGGETRQDFC